MVESEDLIQNILGEHSDDGQTIKEILTRLGKDPTRHANRVWARSRMAALIEAGTAEVGQRWATAISGRRTLVPVYRTKQ